MPLVRADLLAALLEARAMDHAAIALVSVDAIDPTGLGRVVRNEGGTVERIVEDKDATDDERQITEINAGLYAFDAAWLRRRIADLRPSPITGELYLTDLVGFAREDGRLVAALDVDDDGRLDRDQRPGPARARRVGHAGRRSNDRWMRAGVTMIDPSTVYLDHGVELAEDVILEPNVILRGTTRIGERTRIAAGSQIVDSVIGPDCVVWASVIERSTVEDHVTIGPFSHLRPGAHVGPPLGDRQLRRDQEQPPRRARAPAPHSATWAMRTSARTRTWAPARSPPTTTACTSTAPPSASGCSWASTRCCARP